MRYTPYDQTFVDAVRAGGPDANGQPARHCHVDSLPQIEPYAATLLQRSDVAYIDARSSRDNCFLTRIYRDD